jgi:uncharacterized protein YlzI (FlbEa/FlbD family)
VFLKLTDLDGDVVWVNPQHVACFTIEPGSDHSILMWAAGCLPSDRDWDETAAYLVVAESPDEIGQLLTELLRSAPR